MLSLVSHKGHRKASLSGLHADQRTAAPSLLAPHPWDVHAVCRDQQGQQVDPPERKHPSLHTHRRWRARGICPVSIAHSDRNCIMVHTTTHQNTYTPTYPHNPHPSPPAMPTPPAHPHTPTNQLTHPYIPTPISCHARAGRNTVDRIANVGLPPAGYRTM
jgi:hypothetical protein